jgi:hypothetical protein
VRRDAEGGRAAGRPQASSEHGCQTSGLAGLARLPTYLWQVFIYRQRLGGQPVNHMPYEENEVGVPRRENDEAPGRTPQQAEGEDGAERRVPAGEPSKTPGSAEGEGGEEREMRGPPY